MFHTMYAQQDRVDTAACRSAAAPSCRQPSCAADMSVILDAAFVASIFVICLLGRITLFVLLALVIVSVRLSLRSLLTALPLQSSLP